MLASDFHKDIKNLFKNLLKYDIKYNFSVKCILVQKLIHKVASTWQHTY